MTQLQQAREGKTTSQIRRVAEHENISPETVRQELAAGRLVIPANRRHLEGTGGESAEKLDPCDWPV